MSKSQHRTVGKLAGSGAWSLVCAGEDLSFCPKKSMSLQAYADVAPLHTGSHR